jgi:hypothetical protein
MVSEHSQEFARRAEAIYEQRLKAHLEASAMNQYVAIEPESGDYFLAETMGKAVAAARAAYPDRMTHVIRVGHKAVMELTNCRLSEDGKSIIYAWPEVWPGRVRQA